ncbi:MAG TPA: polysaccharide deacetylase family protein [Candidatus Limnocylindrales bacterium]|nr:polysaccharide deacetylase family protein [Candidatus Limnocylindrales bacterium]
MAWLVGLLAALMLAVAVRAQEPSTGGPAWDGTLRRIRVPILMYHYISEPPPDADIYRIDLSVPSELFREHLTYLAAEVYHTITLEELYAALNAGAPLPSKPVVLTFDDGYEDNYTAAFPLLREFGFLGTFFVMTAGPDSINPAYMTWAQISEMSAAGMQMESHTRDHPDLRGRDNDFLVYQLLGAQESIAAHTGKTPRMFAYPAGQYDDAVLALLRSLPVEMAVTTDYGALHTTDAALELARIRMRGTTDTATLAALLATGSG